MPAADLAGCPTLPKSTHWARAADLTRHNKLPCSMITPPHHQVSEKHIHKHLKSLSHNSCIKFVLLSSLLHCEAENTEGRTAHDNEVHAHDKRGQQQRQEQPQGYLACACAAHQADVQARPRDVAGPAPTLLRLPPPRPASMIKGGGFGTQNIS